MSSNNALIDALTLRQILIERYSKGESIRLLRHLKRLSADLKKVVGNEYATARAVNLAKQTEQITKAYLIEYGDDMMQGLREFSETESAFARQAIIATTAAEVTAPASIAQLHSALTRVPMKLIVGKRTEVLTVNQAVSTFSKKRSKEVAQLIRDGYTVGKTSQQMVNEISELVGGKIKNQAASLVRTTTNHMGAQARSMTYAANDDVIMGEEYVATLDSRTTISCAGFDGEIFPIGSGPMPPLHWGCRSVRIPKVNPKYDLGSDIVGDRASVNGPVSGSVTYGGWLGRQGTDVQNEVLGIERAKIFRSGKLSISKFSDDSGKVYSLKRLEELNPLAFKRASST